MFKSANNYSKGDVASNSPPKYILHYKHIDFIILATFQSSSGRKSFLDVLGGMIQNVVNAAPSIIQQQNIVLFPYSPYPPYLASCKFWLCQKVKLTMNGQHLHFIQITEATTSVGDNLNDSS